MRRKLSWKQRQERLRNVLAVIGALSIVRGAYLTILSILGAI